MTTSQIYHPMAKIHFPEIGDDSCRSAGRPIPRYLRAHVRVQFASGRVLPARLQRVAGIRSASAGGSPKADCARHVQPIPRRDRVWLAPFRRARLRTIPRPIADDPSPWKNCATPIDKSQLESKISGSWSLTLTSRRRRVTRTSPSGVAVHLPGSLSRPRDYQPKRLPFFGVPRLLLFSDLVPYRFRVHEVVHGHGS